MGSGVVASYRRMQAPRGVGVAGHPEGVIPFAGIKSRDTTRE